jgi:hypothetical protein
MTKVVLAAEISGTRDGKAWPPIGTEVDLPEDEARDMIDAGTALDPDDDRVEAVKGVVITKEELAGAPAARDWTEGQHDTNLTRAKAMQLMDGDVRDIAREAAHDTTLDDEHTVPADVIAAGGPVVGDGSPSPRQPSDPAEQAKVDAQARPPKAAAPKKPADK